MLHADEVPVDAGIVRALISAQFPQWRDEAVREVPGGTVHAIFRIGDGLAARLPRRRSDPSALEASLRREAAALEELAGVCPVPCPRPVAIGLPGDAFPLPWSVQTWLPGATATPGSVAAAEPFALDLAALIRTLRAAPVCGRRFGGSGRGGRLPDSDAWMAECCDRSAGLVDVRAVRALWARLRTLPPSGPDAMTHGDLIPGNLLVEDGRLVGVLDGGGFGPADPALDLVAAWHLLDARPRAVLRAELGCDDVEWLRGAAWALEQAMGLVWYYRRTLPSMSALGRCTLARLLSDPALAG